MPLARLVLPDHPGHIRAGPPHGGPPTCPRDPQNGPALQEEGAVLTPQEAADLLPLTTPKVRRLRWALVWHAPPAPAANLHWSCAGRPGAAATKGGHNAATSNAACRAHNYGWSMKHLGIPSAPTWGTQEHLCPDPVVSDKGGHTWRFRLISRLSPTILRRPQQAHIASCDRSSKRAGYWTASRAARCSG